ncbi:hypothetical protein DFP72DRAFT_860597 [Ephemerocybe angulata]|uniref:Uncharacterized protein n=1 Tax=Ephemerocybe angulata TaxID=980116 RepID=A0A8H6HA36_9AGAR|nr:hypothetical protein DFP72DRAFT_860597 [Tulosesus angulatus]
MAICDCSPSRRVAQGGLGAAAKVEEAQRQWQCSTNKVPVQSLLATIQQRRTTALVLQRYHSQPSSAAPSLAWARYATARISTRTGDHSGIDRGTTKRASDAFTGGMRSRHGHAVGLHMHVLHGVVIANTYREIFVLSPPSTCSGSTTAAGISSTHCTRPGPRASMSAPSSVPVLHGCVLQPGKTRRRWMVDAHEAARPLNKRGHQTAAY